MPFGLKNAGATYQRAMNLIFDEMIGDFMEVYIDDVLVKFHDLSKHLEHLILPFERMRKFNLKMNPLKCAFGFKASNFLGFLVHKNSIEVDQNKAKAVLEASPPANKKELQKFPGQINYVRREKSSNGSLNIKMPLNKSRGNWGTPPILIPPKQNGKPLRLILHDTKTRYSNAEKRCLSLYDASIKLNHYFMAFPVEIISPTDKAVKGEALVDLLTDHPPMENGMVQEENHGQCSLMDLAG
uniref:Reverse transcriptase domain-containing protein n=1 Tax=Chenopodium quinoa TaxID=63459 RepID=A0A803MNB4_CHEQI